MATGRFRGGDATSIHLRRLRERQGVSAERRDGFLRTRFVNAVRLRADDLTGTVVARAEALAVEVAEATGRTAGRRLAHVRHLPGRGDCG